MIRSAAPTMVPHRRKAASLDEILESKKAAGMFALKQEFSRLLLKKREFLATQRRGSLLVDPPPIADDHPMKEFASFYRKVSNAPMSKEEHPAQLKLIEQVIQESMVVEWPRSIPTEGGVEVDMAPLIHRARNVVKCRTSHPTMRIKVFAISDDPDTSLLRAPPTIEAFFRATLVKLSSEGGEPRQVAGRMILTQREGTAASKIPEQSGASVTADGKLIASQAASEAHTYVILDQMNESAARTTPLRFENGVLCATFPEMGVTLNSMVDRRQLATRYAIQIECALNVDNKLIVNQILLSHAFLIAITNDQTEPLLQSIFWSRLADPAEQPEAVDPPIETPLRWAELRAALTNFIRAQLVQARQLHHHELCHLQCMILLPRVIRCQSVAEVALLETEMFGSARSQSTYRELRDASRELRDRLLGEQVQADLLVERHEFMQDKCISILDMATELAHSPWLWLFRVCEMIQDVGHRLCPSPQMIDKKSSKTKKQMAASEEYQTMCSLFNKGLLTLASVHTTGHAFRHAGDDSRGALLIRFCDENSGYFSVGFGVDESGQTTIGSVSSDHVKDFKQGLAEVLIDESYPAKFDRMMRLEPNSEDQSQITVSLHRKELVFHNYTTTRTRNDTVQVMDSETQRVNPLSGERLERAPLAALTALGVPHLGQESTTPVPWPAHLLVLFQQHLANVKVPEGFNVGTLLAQSCAEGEEASEDDDTE